MADTLWPDSSVLWGSARKLREFADLAHRKGVPVLVHAHIHLEKCRQLREQWGARFSPSYIQTQLDQFRIRVAAVTLDQATAEQWAELLQRRYPTSEAWKQAKLSTVRARLQEGATVRLSDVPMTTDWLVALEIERQGAYAVVGDRGEEWATLRGMTPRHALSYDDAMQWLRERPDADSSS